MNGSENIGWFLLDWNVGTGSRNPEMVLKIFRPLRKVGINSENLFFIICTSNSFENLGTV